MRTTAASAHHRRGTLTAVAELRIQDLLRSVVHDDDEAEPLLGHQRQPLVATAVEMEQLPKAGPRLAAAPVAPARPVLGHQPGPLQRLLHERVAEGDVVLPAGDAQKMRHVEVLIALAIETEHALHLGHRRRFGDGVCRR